MSIPYMTSWEQFAGKLASDINDYVSDYNFSETKTLEYTSPENYSVYICLKEARINLGIFDGSLCHIKEYVFIYPDNSKTNELIKTVFKDKFGLIDLKDIPKKNDKSEQEVIKKPCSYMFAKDVSFKPTFLKTKEDFEKCKNLKFKSSNCTLF